MTLIVDRITKRIPLLTLSYTLLKHNKKRSKKENENRKIKLKKKTMLYFPQDEIGNNFDQIGSMTQNHNSDFHLDSPAWESSNSHDISHGLFRVKHIFTVVDNILLKRTLEKEMERDCYWCEAY